MGNPKEFELESLQDRESIVKYLQALQDGFLKSHIALGTSRKQLLFEPKGLIKIKIKAKQGALDNKITLKFSWKDSPRQKKNSVESIFKNE